MKTPVASFLVGLAVVVTASAIVVALLAWAPFGDPAQDVGAQPSIPTLVPTSTPTPDLAREADGPGPQLVQDPEPTPTATPTLPPTLAPLPRPAASAASAAQAAPAPTFLTLDQLDAAAAAAGWDAASWASMRRLIVECENPSLNPYAHNSSDPAGGSYGLAQLNGRYWFDKFGEDFALRFDPVVNLRTARHLYQLLGRFGGSGGWSCAGRLGIY